MLITQNIVDSPNSCGLKPNMLVVELSNTNMIPLSTNLSPFATISQLVIFLDKKSINKECNVVNALLVALFSKDSAKLLIEHPIKSLVSFSNILVLLLFLNLPLGKISLVMIRLCSLLGKTSISFTLLSSISTYSPFYFLSL